MKLKELITKLKSKPGQEDEVDFIVYRKKDNMMVCAELAGPATNDIMRVLARQPDPSKK